MSIRSMKLTVISSLLGEKKKYRASSVIIVGFSFTEGAMSIYSMRVLHKLMTYISQTCYSLILFVCDTLQLKINLSLLFGGQKTNFS